MTNNLSYTTYDNTKKSHTTKKSLDTTCKASANENIINSITGYEYDLGDRLERLEHEAGMQAKQIEFNECIELVAQLVDLFKRTVITRELQNQNEWHNETQQHLQKNKGATGTTLLDDEVEKIVIKKDLTKEEWSCLLYMTLSTDDMVELTKVSKKHMKKVREKALRLLEGIEQSSVFALINAIEKHTSKIYFIEH